MHHDGDIWSVECDFYSFAQSNGNLIIEVLSGNAMSILKQVLV